MHHQEFFTVHTAMVYDILKHRIILYRKNLSHILEYFTVLTFYIIQNFIYNMFYNFNYNVHVYTLAIFTHL